MTTALDTPDAWRVPLPECMKLLGFLKSMVRLTREIHAFGAKFFTMAAAGASHLCPFILDHAECQRYFHIIAGEPTSRPAERDAKAESASKGFAADPMNLIQVMLA